MEDIGDAGSRDADLDRLQFYRWRGVASTLRRNGGGIHVHWLFYVYIYTDETGRGLPDAAAAAAESPGSAARCVASSIASRMSGAYSANTTHNTHFTGTVHVIHTQFHVLLIC